MNNEIKEIIEYFKDDIDYLEEELKYSNFKGRYITIRDKECEYLRKLLDYITNLKEENKHLDEVNCHLRKKINNDDFDETMKDIKDNLISRIKRQDKEIAELKAKLEMYENGVYFSSENDELQARIDKAIEYIKMNKYYEWHTERDEHDNIQSKKIETTLVNGSKLMNILQGSDKE